MRATSCSTRFRSEMSMISDIPSEGESAKRVPAMISGIREPSFRKYSFS